MLNLYLQKKDLRGFFITKPRFPGGIKNHTWVEKPSKRNPVSNCKNYNPSCPLYIGKEKATEGTTKQTKLSNLQ